MVRSDSPDVFGSQTVSNRSGSVLGPTWVQQPLILRPQGIFEIAQLIDLLGRQCQFFGPSMLLALDCLCSYVFDLYRSRQQLRSKSYS